MEINTYELAMDRMREQENKIQKLTQEIEELQRVPHHSVGSVGSIQSNTAPYNNVIPTNSTAQPPTIINTVVPTTNSNADKPAVEHGEISSTMNVMLEQYDTLDEES